MAGSRAAAFGMILMVSKIQISNPKWHIRCSDFLLLGNLQQTCSSKGAVNNEWRADMNLEQSGVPTTQETRVLAQNSESMTTEEKYMGKLEGKIALITGGNSGIGLATAKRFVNEGAYVFITGRRDQELAVAVKEIGRNVTGVQGDVANLGDLDRLFAQIKREKGKLDIVFANAGGAKFSLLGKITEEHYDSIFNGNVKGLVFTVQKALPLLPDGASIILNASVAGSTAPSPEWSVYNATKAAVRSFARSWTTDLKDRRIRVNAVSPGYTDTAPWHSIEAAEERMKIISNSVPLGRFGTPDEIAKAVVFLASDDSSYVTGTELFVDGGFAQV
jgi:NAD(P)-dependent dehydrogenase (short-subunit alcohol dehydrogenase family)